MRKRMGKVLDGLEINETSKGRTDMRPKCPCILRKDSKLRCVEMTLKSCSPETAEGSNFQLGTIGIQERRTVMNPITYKEVTKISLCFSS